MYVLFIISLFLAIILIAMGWNTEPKNWKLIIPGAIIGAGGLCFMAATPSKEFPNGIPGLNVFGGIVVAFGIGLAVFNYLQQRKAKETKSKEQQIKNSEQALDHFFIECVLAECDDFSQAKNVEKAKLLADKYGLSYDKGVEQLFEKGYSAHRVISERFNEAELNDLRQKEKDTKAELEKYADYQGRDKRIAMLGHISFQMERYAQAAQTYGNTLMRSTQQKERDWAVWGGMASGAAGLGAGVATALDIQAQNAEIRAGNEKRRQALMPAYLSISNSASQNRSNAAKINKEIESIRTKLVYEDQNQDVFSQLVFSKPSVTVTKTGSCSITTKVSAPKDFKIFDDVSAVIDGTVIAHIYDGDTEVGNAKLVFPVYGAGQNVQLTGIGLFCGQPGKKYNVTFTPYKIWGMEN